MLIFNMCEGQKKIWHHFGLFLSLFLAFHLKFLQLCKKPPSYISGTHQLLFPLVNNGQNWCQKLCKNFSSLLILQGECVKSLSEEASSEADPCVGSRTEDTFNKNILTEATWATAAPRRRWSACRGWRPAASASSASASRPRWVGHSHVNTGLWLVALMTPDPILTSDWPRTARRSWPRCAGTPTPWPRRPPAWWPPWPPRGGSWSQTSSRRMSSRGTAWTEAVRFKLFHIYLWWCYLSFI